MTISIRLGDDLEKRLKNLSAATGRTQTYYVLEAVEAYIEDMEDRYLAQSRMEQPAKRLSMSEARKALELDQ